MICKKESALSRHERLWTACRIMQVWSALLCGLMVLPLTSCSPSVPSGDQLNVGLKELDDGQYSQAETDISKAINKSELNGAKEDESLAHAYASLAHVQTLLGNYEGASASAAQSLRVASALSTPTSMDAADAMRALADAVYTYAPEKAVELAKKALAIQKDHLAAEASAIGTTLMVLALARSAQGAEHAGEAVSAAKAAVRIFKQLPDEPLQYARALSTYTRVLGTYPDVDAQDPSYRAKLLEEAIDIKKKQLGKHPEVARDLALLSRIQEGPKQRVELLEEALAIDKKAYGESHAQLADDYALLSEAYEALHRDGEALTARRRAASAFTFSKGRLNATDTGMLKIYASLFHALQRESYAKLVEQVIAAREGSDGTEDGAAGETEDTDKYFRIEQMINPEKLELAAIDHLEIDWIDEELWLNCYKEGEQVVHFRLKQPGTAEFRFECIGPDTIAVGWKKGKDAEYQINNYQLAGRKVKPL